MIVKGRKNCVHLPYDYGMAKEKQLAIPDQSLSIKEIVARYVRGVPVDVKHREPIWLDQSDHDLEKISRMEFSEKMSIAEQLRAEYDAQIEALKQAQAKREKDKAEREASDKEKREKTSESQAQKEPAA